MMMMTIMMMMKEEENEAEEEEERGERGIPRRKKTRGSSKIRWRR